MLPGLLPWLVKHLHAGDAAGSVLVGISMMSHPVPPSASPAQNNQCLSPKSIFSLSPLSSWVMGAPAHRSIPGNHPRWVFPLHQELFPGCGAALPGRSWPGEAVRAPGQLHVCRAGCRGRGEWVCCQGCSVSCCALGSHTHINGNYYLGRCFLIE